MTPQQARMAAMRLRAEKPELQNMAVDDLITQIMASEGMGAPGAGAGGLADLFPTKLTAASPAPMRAARLEAPKPTSQLVPVSNARRPDPRIPVGATGKTLVVNPESIPLADWQKEMISGMQAGQGTAQLDARESAVAAAAPASAPAEEAPVKAKPTSRFRPQLEQKQAELEQLKATIPAGAETPAELAYELRNLSGVVSQLQGLVAAEEGAVVDADRAAILERQTQRLGREEELVERARKRAPFDALIKGGAALASARPGESFASALARGLAAGSESYTGTRDAREAALRGIEERRDAFALQSIDAVQKARDEAIALQDAGMQMTERQMKLANMTQEGATAAALAPFKLKAGKAEASKAETEALYAPRIAEAQLESEGALADYRRRPPAPRAGSAGPKPSGSVYNAIQSRINSITRLLSDPYTSKADKAAYRTELAQKQRELAYYGGLLGINAPAAAAPAKASKPTRTYNPKTGKLE